MPETAEDCQKVSDSWVVSLLKLPPSKIIYAIAKIAGTMLCRAYRRQYGCDFITAMPTNLYGVGDNFDLASSHVVPALMAKAHAAKLANSNELHI